MARVLLATLLVFWLCSVVHAAEVCIAVDTTTWTAEQRSLLVAGAVALRSQAGESALVTRWTASPGEVCFDSPVIDLTPVLVPSALLTRIQADLAAAEQARLVEETRQSAFEAEIASNNVCTAELSDIESRIDAVIDPVSTLVEAKVAMKIALKRIARCLRARAR